VRRPAAAFLHEQATASSLGLARVLVFGIWLYHLAVDPLERLSELPRTAFEPPGVLAVVPEPLWDVALRSSSLLAFKLGLLLALVLVVLGILPSRLLLGLTAAGLVVYQGLVRSFSGHMNHAELALLYISMLFVFFPVFDGLTVRSWRANRAGGSPSRRGPVDRAPYVAGMLAACLVLSLTYFFVGAVRLWKGIDLFGTSTLRDLVASFGLQDGRLDGAAVVPAGTQAALLAVPLLVFQAAFVVSTVIELAAPLAVLSRRLRPIIVLSLLLFHLAILVAMNVPFTENMFLLALFSGTWFHRIAAWLDRSWPDHPTATTGPPIARSISR
jgi:hypothetical protein